MKFSTVLIGVVATASIAQSLSLNFYNRNAIVERHIPFEPEQEAGLDKRFFWPKSPEEAEQAAKREENADASVDKRFWWLLPPPSDNFTKRAVPEETLIKKRFFHIPPPVNHTTLKGEEPKKRSLIRIEEEN